VEKEVEVVLRQYMANGVHGSHQAGPKLSAQMGTRPGIANVIVLPQNAGGVPAAEVVVRRQNAMDVSLATEDVTRFVRAMVVLLDVAAFLVIIFQGIKKVANESLVTQATGRLQVMDRYPHLVTVIHRCTLALIARSLVIMALN